MVIKERRYVKRIEYSLDYCNRDGGFSFPCDVNGNVLKDQMYPEGLENLRKCESGEYITSPPELNEWNMSYWEPAEGKCDVCGETVFLVSSWVNECDKCGTEYNGSGQMLAPRSQWGEETGETF